jgi:hypothetical protein
MKELTELEQQTLDEELINIPPIHDSVPPNKGDVKVPGTIEFDVKLNQTIFKILTL